MLFVPALALLVFVYFYPLARVLQISFIEPSVGFQNYLMIFQNEGIRHVFWTTFRVGLISTLLSVSIGYVVAYYLMLKNGRAFNLALLCVIIPFWISILVRAFAWIIFLRMSGLINSVLIGLGVIDEPLDLLYNEFGVVVGMVHCLVPVATLTLYSQMSGIDRRLIAAAAGLGAGPLYAFWRIFLPMSMPGVISASLLVFISTLGYYIVPAILGGGKTLMVAEYISVMIVGTVNWGVGTAMASVLVVATLVMMLALSRVVDLKKAFGAA